MSFRTPFASAFLADDGARLKPKKRGRYQYGGDQLYKKYSLMHEIFQPNRSFLLETLKDLAALAWLEAGFC
jgi:hypothetical protein